LSYRPALHNQLAQPTSATQETQTQVHCGVYNLKTVTKLSTGNY